ncbi:MAG: M28 family peptidase, partial [Calditrichia bacterium]|nr:M28 family peptidase [Calditrichia bacterium]
FETNLAQAPKWLVKDAFLIEDELGLNRMSYPTHFESTNTLSENATGSDHMAFLSKGIPAIDFTAGTNESPIHTSQDDIRFIDKSSLNEYGLLVDKLISKYQQNGIPAHKNAKFMLWEIFGQQVYIPYWLIIVFNILAILLGISAFIYARNHRILYEKKDRVRFSGLKLLLMLILVIIFAHLGEAFMQLLKGFRYPWIGQTDPYLIYTFIWILAGFWLVLQFSKKWKFSNDPYVYSMRFFIILIIFIIPAFLLSVRLALYPAITMFLLSLAVFNKQPLIKTILVLIAPLFIYHLLFHEEILLMAHFSVMAGISINTIFKAFLLNTVITLVLVVFSLPLLYAFGFVTVSSNTFKAGLKFLRKPVTGIIILVLIVGFGIYLFTLPAYNEMRRPIIRVNAEYKLPQKESELKITGNEYFKDVKVSSDSLNAFYKGRINRVDVPGTFELNWLDIMGTTVVEEGEMDTISIAWAIHSSHPWIRTTLRIWPDTSVIINPESELPFNHDNEILKYDWYENYSDTLEITGKFAIEPGAKLIRKVTARYNEMPVPIKVSSQLANVQYRTTIVYQDTISTSKLNQN